MIRDKIKQALVGAMKAGDQPPRRHPPDPGALKNRDHRASRQRQSPEDDVLVTEGFCKR